MSALVCESISENTPSVCLFRENSNRLVTLWEIMQKAQVASLIKELRDLWITSAMSEVKDARYRDAQLQLTEKHLNGLAAQCIELELPMSSLHIQDTLEAIHNAMDPQVSTRLGTVERACMVLSNNIEKELSLKTFLVVSPERTKFYSETPNPFGASVADSFPSTSYDAFEASRCYALGRNTACVFHLMRVLEIGLRTFANRFNVPSDHTNWHNIIEGIERAVRNMANDPNRPTDWKDQQEFFSQAASNFMFVKDAWRNYTAHARGKYTDEEAETILINVRAFAQKLASRLHE